MSAVGADVYLLAEPNPGENEQGQVMTAVFAVDGAGLTTPGAARLVSPTTGKEDKAWVKSKPGTRVHQSGART